ncbi:MAG: hypothetical protein K0R27_485 [Xanthobacteraceae bacterium]|jgi:uncharacterized membrane protein|nr:hypothetical protein [Xanthobacteraceae bacterium]
MGEFAGLFLIIAFILLFALRRRVKQLETRIELLERGAAPAQVAPVPTPPAEKQAGLSVFAPKEEPTAAPPPASPPLEVPQIEEPAPAGPGRLAGFEERFGALWTVWLGGIALALGGIFLVRYAIEADLIGPGARLTLGALLAVALLAAGEWLRRKGEPSRIALPFADVPAMLTAAGTSTAYAVIYAAYEIYGLLPPGVAFLLLGAVAIASMAAALLHGPMLAALGLVAAGVAPLLVSTDEPSAWGLAVYVAVVAAAAIGVARARLWAWLAALAIIGATLWGLVLLVLTEGGSSSAAPGFLAAVLMALTAAFLVPGLFRGPPAGEMPRPDWVSALAVTGALGLGALLTAAVDQAAPSLILFGALVFAAIVMAWRAEAASHAPLIAAPLSAFVLAAWDVLAQGGTTVAAPGAMEGVVAGPPVLALGGFIAFGLALGALLGLAGYLKAGRAERLMPALAWSAAAVVGPLLLLIAAYWRLTDFGISYGFALAALALAALGTLAVDRLTGREGASEHAATVFATGSVAALALGLTMALERGWLTVGLALASLGIAWIASTRPLPGLRQLSAFVGIAVLGRVMWDPTIAGGNPGATPVLNWLLWGYGVPALSFAAAAWRLGGNDWARRTHESLALIFAVLLAVTEIRHAVRGTLIGPEPGLAEIAGYLCVALAYVIGLERLRRVSASPVYELGSLGVFAIAGLLAFAVLGFANPMVTGDLIEGRFINLLLLAYAVPAVLAFALHRVTRETRPLWHRRASGALALVLAFAYVTLSVRRFFVGPDLASEDLGSGELYAYSAVWLVFGIALLLAGLLSGSRELRLASACIVMLTILKVFLWDMSDLEGVLRALSFIGLGLVLVAIGWLYQHLLLRPANVQKGQPS